jgi:hypothetical protein
LCHMFDSDRLLSDSNDDSDDHSSDKYHTLDQLDTYDTLELENNLINCHNNSLNNHNINDNTNQININNNNININNKRKCLENNGINNNTNTNNNGNNVNNNQKRVPPPNGKKTKGRVKIKMEFIDNKLRRYTTFSKRKTGIMKKAYELSTLTGTQVMLLVASETGHVYTFATRKLQPMITSDAGKALIQTCLNSPDPNSHGIHCGDQRMSATGFEETDLTYSVNDDSPNDKSDDSCPPTGQCPSSGDTSDNGSDSPESMTNVINNNSSATTYAQLENALPLNYLTEANLISNKLASRQLISHLNNNNNVLSSSSSVSNSSSSLINSSATMTNSGTINSSSKLGTNARNKSNNNNNTTIHNTITSLPTMSHSSAQQLLNAGNILLCANGSQLALPPQSSQTSSSTTSTSTTTPTLMYNPTQGVVYATASGGPNNSLLTDGLILNLGQNHNNGTEFLINNNTFSQIQLQHKPIIKREGNKKQRTKQ